MMEPTCPCVFPASTEEQYVTIPGDEPNTALRVYVQEGPGGYVRLQQLAYNAGLGWYVQKSMVVPGSMLAPLIPQLRKAQCVIPQTGPRRSSPEVSIPFMRLAQQDEERRDEEPARAKRREA